MNWFRRNLANMVTSVRLLGAISLFFIPADEKALLLVFGICGLSDGIDGTIARRLGTQSAFGARLDSICDLALYFIMLYKLFPTLLTLIPLPLWCAACVVVLIRIFDYAYTAIRFKHLAALHTVLNKVSGGLSFLLPFVMNTGVFFIWYLSFFAVIAFIAAVQELVIHLRSKQGDTV